MGLNPKGRNWGQLVNWDDLGKFYAGFIISWTVILYAGVIWLVLNRHLTFVKIRNLPLSIAAVSFLHAYLVKIFLAYTTNGHFTCPSSEASLPSADSLNFPCLAGDKENYGITVLGKANPSTALVTATDVLRALLSIRAHNDNQDYQALYEHAGHWFLDQWDDGCTQCGVLTKSRNLWELESKRSSD